MFTKVYIDLTSWAFLFHVFFTPLGVNVQFLCFNLAVLKADIEKIKNEKDSVSL